MPASQPAVRRTHRRRSAVVQATTLAFAVTGISGLAASPALAAGNPAGPPGNNGTVKVHDTAGDHTEHEVAHVGCDFYLDFFGFDGGQQADITLTGQAPTGAGTVIYGPERKTINPQDTRGQGNTWDSELALHVDPSALGAPQAQQGYHVKLTVDAVGAPGGAKQKVFWIAPCATESSTTPEQPPVQQQPPTEQPPAEQPPAEQPPTQVEGTTVTRNPTTTSAAAPGTTLPTEVLGERFTRPAADVQAMAVRRGSLPFTGAGDVTLLAGAGALALAGGTVLVVAGRRRKATSTH